LLILFFVVVYLLQFLRKNVDDVLLLGQVLSLKLVLMIYLLQILLTDFRVFFALSFFGCVIKLSLRLDLFFNCFDKVFFVYLCQLLNIGRQNRVDQSSFLFAIIFDAI